MKKIIAKEWVCPILTKTSLKMKLTTLLLVVSLFKIQANTYSQNTKISIDLSEVSVSEVFNEIESLTEFRFLYKDNELDLKRKVSINVKKETIKKILDKLFNKTNIIYDVFDNRQIVLRFSSEKTSSDIVTVQQTSVRGTVKDQGGNPLPGVTVKVVGISKGTVTDFDGNYVLNNVKKENVLSFSYVGMETKTITIGDKKVMDVTLQESASGLDEVIVTALGIKREKRSLGFTATSVKGSDFERSAAPNAGNALSGKVAGVFITNPSSIEGGSTRITLRGNTSLSGGNTPLIIVDGMPYDNTSEADKPGSNRDYGSALNQIESMDIEDMTVLKGTAAAALYGSRGANGVIIITTKKGVNGKGFQVEYSVNTKVTTPYRYQDFQNEYGYGGPGGSNGILWKIPKLGDTHPNIWGDAFGTVPAINPANGNNYNSWSYDQFSWFGTNASWGPKFDNSTITWWDGEQRQWSAQPNNMKKGYNDGSTITHNLALSTSGSFGNVRASFTLKDNKAIIAKSGFKTTNISIGASLNLGKNLKAELSTTFNRRELTNPPLLGQSNDTFTNNFYNLPRSYKGLEWDIYKNQDGSRNNIDGWGYWISKHNAWNFNENEYKQYLTQMRTYAKLLFTPTDWLSLSGSIGLDFTLDEREDKHGFTDVAGLSGGKYEHSLRKKYSPNLDFLATIHKDQIMEGVNASLSFGGQSWSRSEYEIRGTNNKDKKSPNIYSFANFSNTPTVNDALPKEERFEKRINSLFGIFDVSYKDFLYLQATVRNDWSSTLPKANNDYLYPGASLSFVGSEVIDFGEAVSFAKVRLSYAETGSDTDPYKVIPTFKPDSFGGRPTVSMKDKLPNVNLQSQRSKEYEIGTNWGFFNNKLNVDLVYYKKESYNQILSAPLPWASGYESIKFNTGALELKGFEWNVNMTVIDKQDLRWNLGMNGSIASNKLLALTEGIDIYEIGGLWGAFGTTMKATVGEEFGAIYGWGIQKDANGRRILDTRNDVDGNVTSTLYRKSEKQEIVGNATPKMRGGVNSTLTWKNFTLFTLVDYKWGGDVYNPQYGNALIGGLSPATLKERNGGGLPYTYPSGETANIGVILDGVVETSPGVFVENTNVVHAYYKYAGNGWNPNPQPQAIMENSWVKLRELSLSYKVPSSIVDKIGFLDKVDLSLVGRDLFYIYDTMPDSINPEGLNGVGDANYVIAGALPVTRSFALTFKATF